MPLPVLELNQTSGLGNLLGGVGAGLMKGAEQGMQHYEQSRQLKAQFLQGVLSGSIDPRITAGPGWQAFSSQMGWDNDPDIRKVVDEGQAMMTPEPKAVELPTPPGQAPAMVPPSPQVNGMGVAERALLNQGPPPQGAQAQAQAADKATMPLGGPAVNIPQPYVQPSDKQIQDQLKLEKMQDAATLEGMKEQQQMFWRLWEQSQYLTFKNGLRETPEQVVARAKQMATLSGFDPEKDMQISVDESGKLNVLFKTQNPTQKVGLRDRQFSLEDKVHAEIDKAGATRASLVGHIQGLVSGDIAAANNTPPGMDPKVAANLARIAALIGKGTTKEKVVEAANQIDAYLGQVNEQIKNLRTHIFSLADNANEGAGETVFSDDWLYKNGNIPPISFKDVTGMTKDEYIQKKSPQSAGKLISQVRDSGAMGAPPHAGPSATAAGDATDKTTRAFNDLVAVVQQAHNDNPNLTADQVRQAVAAHKGELMAEYGLNENLYNLVMKMGETILG